MTEHPPEPALAANTAALYERIQGDEALTQALFRQALQIPKARSSASSPWEPNSIFPSPKRRSAASGSLDDLESKQWLIKARGGL
ncbi:TPA: hypothetical protein Q4A38_10595 [Synechococcus sp. WH 5701]|uniref:hypothetical protein n=1 Tax=Synechococcus sp. WH 5701 TaxID=69042 RepID=UPI003C5DA000